MINIRIRNTEIISGGYLEDDGEELAGGRTEHVLGQPQLGTRHKGLAILLHPDTEKVQHLCKC